MKTQLFSTDAVESMQVYKEWTAAAELDCSLPAVFLSIFAAINSRKTL
jgi:hypothetical protein